MSADTTPRAGGAVDGLPARTRDRSSRALDAMAERIGLAAAARIRVGRLTVVTPDGRRRMFGDPTSARHGELHVHDPAAIRALFLRGETGAGEAYMDGHWSSPDLQALIEVAALNREALALSTGWWRVLFQLPRTLAHRARRNTTAQARRNIAAHYDLGNDLYRLFLDPSLTYSSAVFDRDDQTLEDAQRTKYARIAAAADIRPGMHVLEIGSGWGGFALFAAGERGARVTSITISQEQHDLARARVREAGLEDRVDIQLRDYRDIDGQYDAVVSIEMLEAVGAEYFEAYFQAVDRALKPGGRFGLQVITFPDVAYEAQRRGANWIQTYIFPGGLCPSLSVIERSLHGTRLLIRDVTDIAPSYVRTLQAWRERFLANRDEVRALGFDERFLRMWDYYLALSAAGFATGLSSDLQLSLEKARGLAT